LRTHEFKDLTGIVDRIPALDGSVVLEGCPFRVAVGVAGGDIHAVQNLGFVLQIFGNGDGCFVQQPGHHVSPRFLLAGQMKRLDRLFGGLLGGETGPFVPALLPGGDRLLQVPFRLGKPIF